MLFSSWALGVSQPSLKVFLNVLAIVIGVIIASIGEIKFVWIGFIYQIGGIIFEALRLTMVQRLLSSAEFKMDPLVSLYYFAPVCAIMNGVVALFWEVPRVTMDEIYHVGLFTFFLNGMCAFLLNVSVVFLVRANAFSNAHRLWMQLTPRVSTQIGKTSSLVLTLCGVLKDILLVIASIIIWGTQVTALQFFGYSIALAGMIYYKLGYEAIKGYAGEASRQWADFGNRRPVLRRVSVILFSLLLIFVLLGGLAPAYAPNINPTEYLNEAKTKMGIA